MKKTVNLFWIIAIIAVIAIVLTACPEPGNTRRPSPPSTPNTPETPTSCTEHNWNWAAYVSGTGLRQCQNSGCSVTAGTGDTGPGGGIIFYVRPDGFPVTYDGSTSTAHYLEAARNDIGGTHAWATWLLGTADIIGTETGIGTGRENTRLILATDENAPAALATRGGYNAGGSLTDWFLPSKDELNLLYEDRVLIGNFRTNAYWSSSQRDIGSAWIQHFPGGNQSSDDKDVPYYFVRAIRAF